MLMIRLARVGKRGHATFRVVVTEHTRPPKSGALEHVGSYDPHTNTLKVDAERVKSRIAHGAQLSPTVRNLLIEHKVIEGEKVRAWKPRKKPVSSSQPPETAAAAKQQATAATAEPQAEAGTKPEEKKSAVGAAEDPKPPATT